MTEIVTWYVESSECNDHLIYHHLRHWSGVITPLHSFVHSLTHSFIHSSIHSIVCLVTGP